MPKAKITTFIQQSEEDVLLSFLVCQNILCCSAECPVNQSCIYKLNSGNIKEAN